MTDNISIVKLEKDVEYIKCSIDEQKRESKEKHDELKVMITDFISSAESKFAPKWVEGVTKGAIAIILTSFLGALVALIY